MTDTDQDRLGMVFCLGNLSHRRKELLKDTGAEYQGVAVVRDRGMLSTFSRILPCYSLEAGRQARLF